MDALKAKLTTAEQAVVDGTRREAELRAEISMLRNTLTIAQQQHAKVGPGQCCFFHSNGLAFSGTDSF